MSVLAVNQGGSARWPGFLPASLRTQSTLVAMLLLLGLGLRALSYLRNSAVWQDEAALVLNVIGKDFGELLGPLYFSEAAPPLFLWAERVVLLLLGDGPYALRLLPFLASCTAPFLLLFAARRLLRPAAVPWAVLLFCLNDHLFWHAAEAKPYALDVLAATALLALWCRTRQWPVERSCLMFAVLAPIIIFLNYPGCFLLGGLLVALLPSLWRERGRVAPWLGYGLLALAVGVSFLVLALGPARAQHDGRIDSCWQGLGGFPPWDRGWWAVPLWTVKSAFNVLTYCCAPVGGVLAGAVILGAVAFWRRGQQAALVLLLAPAGLALAAAFLGRYPFSGSRVLVFFTPAVVLLIAAGLLPTLDWLRSRSRIASGGIIAIVLAVAGTSLMNLAFPFGRPAVDTASRQVLADFRPGDRVLGNSWEQMYYFRHLGSAFILIGPAPEPDAGRLWLVITDATRQGREAFLRKLPSAVWEPVERQDFYRTSVFLLQPARQHAEAPRPLTSDHWNGSHEDCTVP